MLLRAFVLLLWIGVASGLALPRAIARMSASAAPPPATSPAERAFFDGRVCWVTGASSGIGRATSVALAAAGARVILSARREDTLRAVAAECAAVGPTGDESCVSPRRRSTSTADEVTLRRQRGDPCTPRTHYGVAPRNH